MLDKLNEGDVKLDPRVKRTRHMIVEAFMTLINDKGFKSVTVQDITGQAGINRATFYAHFKDKYSLLDYSIREGFLQEIDKRMLNACHLSLENLHNLIVAVCEYIKSINSRCKTPQNQFESLVESQVKAVLHELLLNWLEKVKIDLDPETTATAASWSIYGLALQWSHSKQPKPVDEFAAEVLPLVAANLKLIQAL